MPVLIGVGEVDIAPDPWAEPSAYRRSSHVTLVVLRGSAHMHNFSAARADLWQELTEFAKSPAVRAASTRT